MIAGAADPAEVEALDLVGVALWLTIELIKLTLGLFMLDTGPT